MGKTILVVGFGPGISTAVAETFGAQGFRVGLIGRSEDKLAAGARALREKGIEAEAFVGDAGDPTSIRSAIAKARAAFGGLTVIHWNAAAGAPPGDLMTIDPESLAGAFRVGTVGLLSAVQEALPDLKAAERGALLITNGALGDIDPQIDAMALRINAVGGALANATKRKFVGLLAARLKDEGVYVGEVVVAAVVKGTASDRGNATLEPANVAKKFWELYEARSEVRARVS